MMPFIEGRDYALVAGRRWWPFGRRYRLLRPIAVTIDGRREDLRAGWEWDGPTAWPIRRSSPQMLAFLHHDREDQARLGWWFRHDLILVGRLWRAIRHPWDLLTAAAVPVLMLGAVLPSRLFYRWYRPENRTLRDRLRLAVFGANLAGLGGLGGWFLGVV